MMNNKNIVFLMTCFMTQTILYSMNEDKQIKKSKKEIVFVLLINNSSCLLDHQWTSSCAKINKEYRALILSIRERKKNIFVERSSCEKIMPSIIHKYSMNAYSCHRLNAQPDKEYGELHLDHHMFDQKPRTIQSFSNPAADRLIPILLKVYPGDKDVHLYVHTERVYDVIGPAGIWCYCSNPPECIVYDKRIPERMLCGMRLKENAFFGLSHFASYPFLLNAILDVKGSIQTLKISVEEKVSFFEDGETPSLYNSLKCLIFNFKDVILPDNYHERVEFRQQQNGKFDQFFIDQLNRNAEIATQLDGLPQCIQDAISDIRKN